MDPESLDAKRAEFVASLKTGGQTGAAAAAAAAAQQRGASAAALARSNQCGDDGAFAVTSGGETSSGSGDKSDALLAGTPTGGAYSNDTLTGA